MLSQWESTAEARGLRRRATRVIAACRCAVAVYILGTLGAMVWVVYAVRMGSPAPATVFRVWLGVPELSLIIALGCAMCITWLAIPLQEFEGLARHGWAWSCRLMLFVCAFLVTWESMGRLSSSSSRPPSWLPRCSVDIAMGLGAWMLVVAFARSERVFAAAHGIPVTIGRVQRPAILIALVSIAGALIVQATAGFVHVGAILALWVACRFIQTRLTEMARP